MNKIDTIVTHSHDINGSLSSMYNAYSWYQWFWECFCGVFWSMDSYTDNAFSEVWIYIWIMQYLLDNWGLNRLAKLIYLPKAKQLSWNLQALNIELKASLAEAEESIKLQEKRLNDKSNILEATQAELALVKKANEAMV